MGLPDFKIYTKIYFDESFLIQEYRRYPIVRLAFLRTSHMYKRKRE